MPQVIYPESLSSSLSGPLNKLLKSKLREHALVLRSLSASLRASAQPLSEEAVLQTLRARKEELMQEVYTVMSATLGVPPKADAKFVWDYYNKDGKPGHWEGTPVEFYKAFAFDKYSVCHSLLIDGDGK